MSDQRTTLAGAGYAAVARTRKEWSSSITEEPRGARLGRLIERLPDGAEVVEVGCGNGTRFVQGDLASIEPAAREPEGDVSFHRVLAQR